MGKPKQTSMSAKILIIRVRLVTKRKEIRQSSAKE
jgi:hypothetical protein